MALNQDYPVLNGIVPSWADISVTVQITDAPLIEMKDIKAIKSASSLDIGEQRGASGGRVMNRTTGASKQEASCTMYYTGYVKFLEGLALAAPQRGDEYVLSLVHFDIIQMFTPPGNSGVFQRHILGCRYTGGGIDAAEGTDAQPVDVSLNPVRIVEVLPSGKRVVVL